MNAIFTGGTGGSSAAGAGGGAALPLTHPANFTGMLKSMAGETKAGKAAAKESQTDGKEKKDGATATATGADASAIVPAVIVLPQVETIAAGIQEADSDHARVGSSGQRAAVPLPAMGKGDVSGEKNLAPDQGATDVDATAIADPTPPTVFQTESMAADPGTTAAELSRSKPITFGNAPGGPKHATAKPVDAEPIAPTAGRSEDPPLGFAPVASGAKNQVQSERTTTVVTPSMGIAEAQPKLAERAQSESKELPPQAGQNVIEAKEEAHVAKAVNAAAVAEHAKEEAVNEAVQERPEKRVANSMPAEKPSGAPEEGPPQVSVQRAEVEAGRPLEIRGAMHVERLMERLAGPEMRFGFHSVESGSLQVSASLHGKVVEVGITAERAETATALRAELPALDAHLREHALRLGEARIASGTTMSTHSQMGEQRRQQQEWRQALPRPGGFETTAGAREPESTEKSYSSGRISLLA